MFEGRKIFFSIVILALLSWNGIEGRSKSQLRKCSDDPPLKMKDISSIDASIPTANTTSSTTTTIVKNGNQFRIVCRPELISRPRLINAVSRFRRPVIATCPSASISSASFRKESHILRPIIINKTPKKELSPTLEPKPVPNDIISQAPVPESSSSPLACCPDVEIKQMVPIVTISMMPISMLPKESLTSGNITQCAIKKHFSHHSKEISPAVTTGLEVSGEKKTESKDKELHIRRKHIRRTVHHESKDGHEIETAKLYADGKITTTVTKDGKQTEHTVADDPAETNKSIEGKKIKDEK